MIVDDVQLAKIKGDLQTIALLPEPFDLEATNPITVRHGNLQDLENLHQLLSEPSVIYWLDSLPYGSIELLRNRLSLPHSHSFLLVATYHQTLVGMVELTINRDLRQRHGARLSSLVVAPGWRGWGVATALLQAVLELTDCWCHIHRLELLVCSDHHGAIALYQKFNFRREGTLKDYAFRDGEYIDVDVMARLR